MRADCSLADLLGKRIALADRAGWCRRARHARDGTHFAVETSEFEALAAFTTEPHGRSARPKIRVEGNDQLIGAVHEVRGNGNEPVALEVEIPRGFPRVSLCNPLRSAHS